MHIFVANLLKCNFCNHFIIAAFISILKVPETFHARFPVRSSLYRYYSMASCKNKPLVSWEHPQGICQNRFVYILERSSEVLVTLPLSNRGVGVTIFEQAVKAFQICDTSLTTTRIFKMEDDFSVPPGRSFGSSRSGEGTHDEARRTSAWYAGM